MSELMNKQNTENGFRWHLMMTVSALALLASVSMRDAKAADQDSDRPTVWIELGGDLQHVSGQGDPFVPGFVAANPNSPVLHPVTPIQAQNPEPFTFGESGKISFQPEGSDWILSAAVRYGRSSNLTHVKHQTDNVFYKYHHPTHSTRIDTKVDFADTQARHDETHAILDFVVGKDVGLGMFGRENSSTLNFGVRIAQFSSKASFDVRARPDRHIKYYPSAQAPTRFLLPYFHTYHATGQASRSFRGVGPTLSWNGAVPFAGNSQSGEVTFDLGANAAVLFGRQKTRVRHHESGHYSILLHVEHPTYPYPLVYDHPNGGHDNARSVIVPNVGGFAGASYRIENVKVSFGYRADIFFGAIDGGIDTAKRESVGFYGPFASVSVGIGG